jgi:hypothetical protein
MVRFMRYFSSVLAIVAIAISVFAGGEGVVGDKGKNLDQSVRSTADWYTAKRLNMVAESGTITIATKWPGLILKGFRNNSRDSSLTVKVIYDAGDTETLSIPSETTTNKLPVVAKVFKTGTTTDTLHLTSLFQKQ